MFTKAAKCLSRWLVASLKKTKTNSMETHDFPILLTFLILLIPFGLIWFIAFRYLKKTITTALNYSVLTLFSLMGLIIYYALTWFLAISFLKGPLSNLIGPTCYGTIMLCQLLIIPILILTLILTIIHFVDKPKKKTTN